MNEVIKVSGGVTGDYLKDAIKSQKFADVALCCSGGQKFLAHRLILSAASPYLYEVLRAHGTIAGQCEVITLILADVEGNDLEAILSFLYTGSVMVPKARLEAFSSTANALKIKIPPIPLELISPYCPTDYFNHCNYLEYQSKTEENNKPNSSKIHNNIDINFLNDVRLKLKVIPTECIRQSMVSSNYHDDIDNSYINLKVSHIPTSRINKFKTHIANRVFASPWCQITRPYHSPKIQPIILQNYNSISTNDNYGDNPSSLTFSATVPHRHTSFTHERLTGSLNEMTVGVRRMYNPDSHDPSNQIPVDYPQDMSRSAQMTLTFEKIAKDDNETFGEIISSPKIHSPSRDQCQFDSEYDQSYQITPANLNNTTESGNLKDNDIQGTLLNTVQPIRWSDGNNNNNSVNVKNSERNFTNDREHKCHVCKRIFSNRTSLKIHSRCHTGEKPFRCLDCGKEFSQLRNYKYHRSVHEGTGEFAGTCPECGKCFNDRGYLGSHMKIHRNRKEYVCQECGKSFNQRVAYNMHVRIHTGVKPHHCEQCGKAFSRKMLLKQHLRTHSGERPYQCHICQKAFADRSNMTLHTRLHSGLKPYQCDICSKAFTKKHHLKTHLNYHTGTKPYSCPNCSVAFSQSSNMRTHYKKCMANKPDGNVSNKIES